MKLLAQISIAFLIVIKIALGTVFIYWVETGPFFLENNAIAAESQELPVNEIKDDGPVENETISLTLLLAEKAEIEKKEVGLENKKKELISIRQEIDEKIAVLTLLRNEIRSQVEEKKAIQGKKLKHIIKAYSSMKPQKAASLIEKLDIKFATELLSMMKGEVVGNILSYVGLDRAAKISEELAMKK